MSQRDEAHGVEVWSDGAWLYRERDGVRRCIGIAEEGFRILEHGAVLVHDGDAWVSGAAPRGSVRPLAAELQRDTELTTLADGRFLLARDAQEMEVLLDLKRGRAIDLLGPVVASPERWATAHWDSGEGRFFDPRTAEVLGTFQVDVADDDVIVSGELRDGQVIWHTAEGRVLTCQLGDRDVAAP